MYSFNLIKILTVENQANKYIYEELQKLFELLNSDKWIQKFIFWELNIIKLVGYDINFSDYVDNNITSNSLYVTTLDGEKKIPSFLLKINDAEINKEILKDGLNVVGDFLNKSVLIPNNINYPLLRTKFVKLL